MKHWRIWCWLRGGHDWETIGEPGEEPWLFWYRQCRRCYKTKPW